VPTGYGQQTALFAPKVAEHFDTAISAFCGLDGARLEWKGVPVLPGSGGDFGNNFLLQHAKHFFGEVKDGIVFTLQDVWPLSTGMAARMNMACWTPVDHEPAMPGVTNFFKDSGATPIAMSRFGEAQLQDLGSGPYYIPHGVDTKVFRPHEDKASIRRDIGIPEDAFLIGMVAANKGAPSRKGFNQAFQAFSIFRRKHPEARLYLHTVPDANYAAGEDLEAMAIAHGIQDAVIFPPRYQLLYSPFHQEMMAQLYSAMDVFLNPAWGEGFGVPILESAACGIPAVVTNFTAMPEVAGPAGWAVACRHHWTAGKSFMAIPDVEEIVLALEQCYSEPEADRRARSAKAREHALGYDVDKVFEDHMLPVLKEIERTLEQPTMELSEPLAVSGKLAIEK